MKVKTMETVNSRKPFSILKMQYCIVSNFLCFCVTSKWLLLSFLFGAMILSASGSDNSEKIIRGSSSRSKQRKTKQRDALCQSYFGSETLDENNNVINCKKTKITMLQMMRSNSSPNSGTITFPLPSSPVQPPTVKPTSAQPCPDTPAAGCSICGDGLCVGSRDNNPVLLGCLRLEILAMQGKYDCSDEELSRGVMELCSCVSMRPPPNFEELFEETTAPSSNPSLGPTEQPTLIPTQTPTPRLTANPIQKPAPRPTPKPTEQPTRNPIPQPTRNPTPDPTSSDEVILDVLIVGGGWSGVSALEYLIRRGFENVRLLEARDYLGGRSRTKNNAFGVKDLAIELGSAWVFHDTELQDMVDYYGLNYGEIDYSDWSYLGLYADGSFNDDDVDGIAWQDYSNRNNKLSEEEKMFLLRDEWEEWFVPFSRNQTEELYENSSDDNSDDIPYETILEEYWRLWGTPERNRYRSFINGMVHTQLSLEYAAPLDQLSTKAVGEAVNSCIFCGSDHYMAVENGGFGNLIKAFVEPVITDTNVQLNSRVTQIKSNDDDGLVRVTYTNQENGKEQVLQTRTVLVTVPLGVLKAGEDASFKFVPRLPGWKRRAIDLIGFGLLDKCIMYWKSSQRSWWPENESVVTLLTDDDDEAGFWTTYFNDRDLGNGGHFILTGWIGGDNAEWSEENLSDEEMLQTNLRHLRSMFGRNNVPDPTDYIVTRWGQDPYALGSYSYAKSNSPVDIDYLRETLFEPVANDRIYFAGEATNKFYGTTTGAHRSGIRAASLIRRWLN